MEVQPIIAPVEPAKDVPMEVVAVAPAPAVVVPTVVVPVDVPVVAPVVAAVDPTPAVVAPVPAPVIDTPMPAAKPKRSKPIAKRNADAIRKRQRSRQSIESFLWTWRSWCFPDCEECPTTRKIAARRDARHSRTDKDGDDDAIFYSCVLKIDMGEHKVGDRIHHIEWRPSAGAFVLYPTRSNQKGELYFINKISIEKYDL